MTVISDMLRYRFSEAAHRNLSKHRPNDERCATRAAILQKLVATSDALDPLVGREVNDLFGATGATGQQVLLQLLDQVGFGFAPEDATEFAARLADMLRRSTAFHKIENELHG